MLAAICCCEELELIALSQGQFTGIAHLYDRYSMQPGGLPQHKHQFDTCMQLREARFRLDRKKEKELSQLLQARLQGQEQRGPKGVLLQG